MEKQQLIEWALPLGYRLTLHGHLQKQMVGFVHRLKLQDRSVRSEIKEGTRPWFCKWSAYYKNLSINPDNGKLVVHQKI